MRRLLFTTATLLLGVNACLAQVSTMGTTAMGLPSTPGTIVTSPLNGPSPFSATTQPGTLDTTLAPVPLASDPTIPGTVVTCSTPTGQITPGTPAVPVSFLPSAVGTAATPLSASPTTPIVPATSSTPATGSTATLTLPAQPATSFPGVATPPPQPTVPALPSPSIKAIPVPTSSTAGSAVSPAMPGATTAALSPTSSTAMTSSTPLGTIPSPIVITTTGNPSPTSPLGSPSSTVCSSVPGGPPTNAAALPLSTPEIPNGPPPGTIQPAITELGGTSIDPAVAVMATPNTPACAESMTMNLAAPAMMAPANATGATATPGVSSPSGC
jgi:hypothetical protein